MSDSVITQPTAKAEKKRCVWYGDDGMSLATLLPTGDLMIHNVRYALEHPAEVQKWLDSAVFDRKRETVPKCP